MSGLAKKEKPRCFQEHLEDLEHTAKARHQAIHDHGCGQTCYNQRGPPREHLKVRHLQKDVASIEASQVARGGKLTDLDSIQLPRMKELSGH